MVSEFAGKCITETSVDVGSGVKGRLSIDIPGKTPKPESFSFEPPQPMDIGPLGKDDARLDYVLCAMHTLILEPANIADSFTVLHISFFINCVVIYRYYCMYTRDSIINNYYYY